MDSCPVLEDDALEAAERLARELISAEAERVAAIGCAKHLQHLLRQTALNEQVKSGGPAKRTFKHGKKLAGPQAIKEADKENAHPTQFVGPNSCMQTDTTKVPTVDNIGSPMEAARTELHPEAQLSAMARSAGRLRAQCAQQQEQSMKHEHNLMQARELLTERTARTTSLRKCSVEFMEELRQRDVTLSDLVRREMHEGQMALQQAHSELQHRNSELSQLSRTIDIVQAHRHVENRTFQDEAQAMTEERSALRRASDQVCSELQTLRDQLKDEERQVCEFRKLDETYVIQLREMGLCKVGFANLQLEDQCRAWKQEVVAQHAEVCELKTEHEAMQTASVAAYARTEHAAAEKMSHMRSHSEVLACELADMRTALFSQREHVAGEEQLCARLASRLKSKDRAVRRLRQEHERGDDQRSVLKTIEQQLKALQSNLSKKSKYTNKGCVTGAAQVQQDLQEPPHDPASVPPDVCHEEAARILVSAAPRLGIPADEHGGDRAGGGSISRADLPHLASATRAAVQAIRGELVQLVTHLHATLPSHGKMSTAGANTLTVRALMLEARQLLRNLPPTAFDLGPGLTQHQKVEPGEQNRNAEGRSQEGSGVDPEKVPLTALACSSGNGEEPVEIDESVPHTPNRSTSSTSLPCDCSGMSPQLVSSHRPGISSNGPVRAMHHQLGPEKPYHESCHENPARFRPSGRSGCCAQHVIAYPESLAGSPAGERGMQGTPDLFEVVPSVHWSPDEEMCIEEFLGGRAQPAAVPKRPVSIRPPGTPIASAPLPPRAESPSACVRRARGRLRELRLGVLQPTDSHRIKQLPSRSASVPSLMR